MQREDRLLRWLTLAAIVAVAYLTLRGATALYLEPLEMRAAALGALATLAGAFIVLLAAAILVRPIVRQIEASSRQAAAQTAGLLRTSALETRAHAQAANETAKILLRARRLLTNRGGGFHWDRDAIGSLLEGCGEIERDFAIRATEFPEPSEIGAAFGRVARCARDVVPRLRELGSSPERSPVAVQNEVVEGLDALDQALAAASDTARARLGELWAEIRRAEARAAPGAPDA